MVEQCGALAVADWSVAVVMPAHDEEGLVDFIEEIDNSLRAEVRSLHFVVVDDDSMQPVSALLSRTSGCLPVASPVTVIRNSRNMGHGPSALAAYEAGLALGVDVVVHVDGDGQFRGADFPRLLLAMVGFDGAVGVRMGREEPWFRRVLSSVLRRIVCPSARLSDVNSPMRAYTREAARRLVDSISADSLVPHVHWTRRHAALGLRVAGVPVESLPRRGLNPIGTTWGTQRNRQIFPSKRLMVFVFRAFLEVSMKSHPARSTSPVAHPLVEEHAA